MVIGVCVRCALKFCRLYSRVCLCAMVVCVCSYASMEGTYSVDVVGRVAACDLLCICVEKCVEFAVFV